MQIRHSGGGYPIEFLSPADLPARQPNDHVLITDEHVAAAHPHLLSERSYVTPPGEKTKSFTFLERISEWLAESGASRSTTLVALGGGVIGDLAGLVAATYMRGIPYIQVPTSLLAQVDSSVGGKVAIDLRAGKNLFGAFYPPIAVLVAIDVLATLPERHFRNGSAEIWKHGAILDAALFEELCRQPLRLISPNLEQVIRRSIAIKAGVVESDEFETKGLRAVLNFGHTIGHALEVVTGYDSLLHGEAVSIGMVAEARLGELMGITECGTAKALLDGLASQGLPVRLPRGLLADELVSAMRKDKKASRGGLTFSLLTRLGHCHLVDNVPEGDVRAILGEEL
jgi:3-dehydroquinate synthase